MKFLKSFLVALLVILIFPAQVSAKTDESGTTNPYGLKENEFVVSEWKATGTKTYKDSIIYKGEQGCFSVEYVGTVGKYNSYDWKYEWLTFTQPTSGLEKSVKLNSYNGKELTEKKVVEQKVLTEYKVTTKTAHPIKIYHTKFVYKTPKYTTIFKNKVLIGYDRQYKELTSKSSYPTYYRSGWEVYSKWTTFGVDYTYPYTYSFEESKPKNTTNVTYTETGKIQYKYKVATRTHYYSERKVYDYRYESAYEKIDFSKGSVFHIVYAANPVIQNTGGLVSNPNAGSTIHKFFFKKKEIYDILAKATEKELQSYEKDICIKVVDYLDIGLSTGQVIWDVLSGALKKVGDEKAEEHAENIVETLDDSVNVSVLLKIISGLRKVIDDAYSISKMRDVLIKEGLSKETSTAIAECVFDIAWRHGKDVIQSSDFTTGYTIMIIMDTFYKEIHKSDLNKILEFGTKCNGNDIIELDFSTNVLNGAPAITNISISVNNCGKVNTMNTKEVPINGNCYVLFNYSNDFKEINDTMAITKLNSHIFSVNNFARDLYDILVNHSN